LTGEGPDTPFREARARALALHAPGEGLSFGAIWPPQRPRRGPKKNDRVNLPPNRLDDGPNSERDVCCDAWGAVHVGGSFFEGHARRDTGGGYQYRQPGGSGRRKKKKKGTLFEGDERPVPGVWGRRAALMRGGANARGPIGHARPFGFCRGLEIMRTCILPRRQEARRRHELLRESGGAWGHSPGAGAGPLDERRLVSRIRAGRQRANRGGRGGPVKPGRRAP